MSQSKKPSCAELPNICQIFKQEEEWKQLLAEEVDSLQRTIIQKEEKISEQKVQLDELKKSFIYNYDLLKSRDAELSQYDQILSKLQAVLAKREAEISELRVCLDQTKEDQVKSQNDAVDWRTRFEEVSRQSVAKEAELRRAANSTLAQLADSEAAERRRLTAEVARLQADLEAERARSATDLDAALAEASRRASEASAEAGRARMAAEMRATTAEDAASRAKQEARRLNQELLTANDALARLDSEMAAKTQAVQQAAEAISGLKEALAEVEKAKATCELKLSRLESRRELEKNAMMKEVEILKESEKSLKMQVYTLNRGLTSLREEAESENRRLLDAVASTEKVANQTAEALDAVEVERQLAIKASKTLESENRRLRADLNRALAHGNALDKKKFPVPQENGSTRDLVAQIISLQLSCSRLQEENRKLRRQSVKISDALELRRQLDSANQQIECLKDENIKLLHLSNKTRARQMRDGEFIAVPPTSSGRWMEPSKGKLKRCKSGELPPEVLVYEKMSPRGGDEISSGLFSGDEDDSFRPRNLLQFSGSNTDKNNNWRERVLCVEIIPGSLQDTTVPSLLWSESVMNMYFPPSSRREPVVTTSSIQKILDDNVHLIHNIINHQKAGNNNHEMQELQVLHKNLIYLATIADQATNSGAAVQRGPPPPPPGFSSGPAGPPEHTMPLQPPSNASYPSGSSQSRGQPMPPNYMSPIGRFCSDTSTNSGAPMMPQHQHGLPPQQQQQHPPPPQVGGDDRDFMQQRPGPLPPYGYPPGPPPPPSQQQPQHQSFTVAPGGDFGAPRYDNAGQPVGTMSGEAGAMLEAPSVAAPPSISSSSSGVGGGAPPPIKSSATPSPKLSSASDQQAVGEQQPARSQTPNTSAC
ncbi:Protein SSXT [Taenia crassiceps]|uniref:Protein SSXT n=1 Tax=Taenia crassiceps TaxID=6207 RepID=A0ABR4Q0N4_9CEST